jgi:hypothetical protein
MQTKMSPTENITRKLGHAETYAKLTAEMVAKGDWETADRFLAILQHEVQQAAYFIKERGAD